MPGLLAMTVLVFAGFGLLLPLSPLWAVQGGADERGAGLVTATLMLFTVLAQLRVNTTLATLGWGRTLALGLVLLAAPAPVQALTPDLWLVLATSAVRGLGFGILTVCGATAISLLVAPEARGRAVGAYGLVIAVPQLVLTPAAPWLLAEFGFPLVATFGAVPLIAVAVDAAPGRAHRVQRARRRHAHSPERVGPAHCGGSGGRCSPSCSRPAREGRCSRSRPSSRPTPARRCSPWSASRRPRHCAAGSSAGCPTGGARACSSVRCSSSGRWGWRWSASRATRDS